MSARASAWRLGAIAVSLLELIADCAVPPGGSPNNLLGAATSSPNVLTFMVWGSGPELQANQALVTHYNLTHPNQPVNLVGLTSAEDYQKRLAADLAAGAPADVLVLNYLNLLDY